MAEELLRRSRVVVACSTKVNENVKMILHWQRGLGLYLLQWMEFKKLVKKPSKDGLLF